MTIERAMVVVSALLTGCNLIFSMDEGKPRPDDGSAGGSGAGEDGGGGVGGSGAAGGEGEGGCAPVANYQLPWACLDEVELQNPGCDNELVYHFVFVTFTDSPLSEADLVLKVCAREDDSCSNPEQTLYPNTTTGEQFVLLSPSFDGYLDFDSQSYKEGIIELGPPTTLPQKARYIPLISQPEFEAQLMLAMPPIQEDPERATLLLGALNCTADYQDMMKFDSPEKDGATSPFYLGQWFFGFRLDPMATETKESGGGGFVNMPIGDNSVSVRTIRASDNRVIGEADGLFVRPSEITYLHLGPTP